MKRLMLILVCFGALAAQAAPQQIVPLKATRAEIQQLVKTGPQRFVAQMRVTPERDPEGAFVGFRIVGFVPDAPLLNNKYIRPGDVVVSINDEPIARPEQFMRAWEVASAADRVEVSILRGGQPILFRWTVTKAKPKR